MAKKSIKLSVPGRSATIWEVARELGVSAASVSRALNGKPGVAQELAAKIRSVAKGLGYVPSTNARSLVTGRSRTVGLVVADIVNPFFSELLRKFEQEAERAAYEIVVVTIDNERARVGQGIKRLLERKVDAVAVMMVGQTQLAGELRKRHIPTVFFQGTHKGPTISNVNVNSQNGIDQAVCHLRALNHRKVAYIGPGSDLAASKLRMEAIEAAAAKHAPRFDKSLAFLGYRPTLQGGYEGMLEFIENRNNATSVIMFNDAMAFGALRAARERGVRIPEDLSLIGFDDVEMSQFVGPPLTTVRFSRSELATSAFGTLLRMVRNETEGEVIVLNTDLVVRESTAVAPVL